MSGPFPVGFALVGPVLLSVVGLVLAVFGLIRSRGLAGLLALLLAALSAGAGVAAQVRAEREIERFLTTGGAENRAAVERGRIYRYPHAQSVGRTSAIAALLPLVLGAIAALRRPLGSRALALGFMFLAVFVWGAAWRISHRPLPVDRYDFAEDDDDAWLLAIAIDDVYADSAFLPVLAGECERLDSALRVARTRRRVPAVLEAPGAAAAQRCVRGTLAVLASTRDPAEANELRRALLDSVSLQDEAVRQQLTRAIAPAEDQARSRVLVRDRLQELLGRGSYGMMEEVLAAADAGVK